MRKGLLNLYIKVLIGLKEIVMRPDKIIDNAPPYLYQIEHHKPKPKWAWRAFWWGFWWGVIFALPFGYIWAWGAGRGI